MKITNFKMYPLMIAIAAFLALSGCDSTTGTVSDSGLGMETPAPAAPLPDAGISSVTANPVSISADGTSKSTITVTVSDENADPITNATVILDQGAGSSTIGAVTNVGDGTYTFIVTSTTPETVTYTATANGVVIMQTADVTFTATPVPPTPVPDPGTSTVTASPVTIAADGSETSTVTVTVNDANSNPITNATVILDQGAGNSAISTVTNVGDGTYTFDVTSTTPETVTYTATANGVIITQTADITFTQTEAQCLAAAGYGTIDINGRTWLDKNLGAGDVAGDLNDTLAYGDLYQWGRSSEGHQDRSSLTTVALATTIDPNQGNTWDGMFIVNPVTGNDWVESGVDNNGSVRSLAWSTPNDKNQVCPCGYVVPSTQDFIDLNLTLDNGQAFYLTMAGFRENREGNITRLGKNAFFWTSEVNAQDNKRTNLYMYTNSNGTISESSTDTAKRSNGYSIRCIKPTP